MVEADTAEEEVLLLGGVLEQGKNADGNRVWGLCIITVKFVGKNAVAIV